MLVERSSAIRPSGPGRQARMGRLATAMMVDSFGSGLFGPFGLLYAHVVVGLSLPAAGAALAAVGVAALALGPVAGALVDRFTAARVAVAGNLCAALAGGLLFLARDLPLFLLASFLGAAAIRTFWAAFVPLVGDAVEPTTRERWFGLLRGARYAGMAAGGLMASAVMLLGQQRGLLLMVALDGVSYLVAGLLIASAGVRPRTLAPGTAGSPPSYRTALRDRGNLALALLNVVATSLITAPAIAMPVYVLSVLDQPVWVPGMLAGTGTAALAIGVTVVHRLTANRRRLMVLASANLVWAIGALAYATASLSLAGLTVIVLFVAVVAFGVGEALYGPTADALPLAIAPPGMAGRYTAIHQIAWGISGAGAPALVGTLMGRGPVLLWLILAALAVTAATAYRLLPASTQTRAQRVGWATETAPTAPAVAPDSSGDRRPGPIDTAARATDAPGGAPAADSERSRSRPAPLL